MSTTLLHSALAFACTQVTAILSIRRFLAASGFPKTLTGIAEFSLGR